MENNFENLTPNTEDVLADAVSEDVSSLTEAASQMAEAEKASTSIINELNVSNEEMIDSIEKIATQIEITNTSVQEIRPAIAMIHSISNETDLLSINASIEAAQTMKEAMTAVKNASQKLKNMSDDLTKELEIFKLS